MSRVDSSSKNSEQLEVEATSPLKRLAYARPVLTVYGDVKELTRSNTGSQSGDSNTMMPSDRLVKEDIVEIGQHPLGFGLYLFNYKVELRDAWGRGRHFGVMADEVESKLPQAVSVHPDGYKQVNYSLLGVYPRMSWPDL